MRRLSAESGSALRELIAARERGSATQDAPKTVTVARLLAEQGHVTTAREVLGDVLARSPEDEQAAALSRQLAAMRDRARRTEPAAEAVAPRVDGTPAAIAAFRQRMLVVARLNALLDRVVEARREPPR